ncbi:MAG: TRAP transporter large permease subunit [Rhizobiales bacterium]|nr:TRAP transporter large permease subunit [Hyphomicrobiales bacterium]
MVFAILAGLLIFAFAIGLHVFVTLGLSGMALAAIFSDRPILSILGDITWNTASNVTLLALPLYVLMGEILLRTGITEGMYESLSKWLNRLPGSLTHTNIVASGMFACISGSSAATAATVGSVALPYLRKEKYDDRMALGSIAAGGTLGILLPPSIVLIVYGVLAETSIGQLYLAGVVPGVILMVAFMTIIAVYAILKPSMTPKSQPTSWSERIYGLVHLVPIVLLVSLVVGSIYAGVATATEAAAFGVSGAFVLGLAKRRITFSVLADTFLATASTTAMIVAILISAFFLQFVASFLGIPNAMNQWMSGLGLSATETILMICVIYIFLGMFMESLSIIVVTIPLLIPLLEPLGIDLVWFGIIVVILVEIALITPPVGMNLFILRGISEKSKQEGQGTIKDIYIGVFPFVIALLVVLALIVAVPEIVLWLPQSAMQK